VPEPVSALAATTAIIGAAMATVGTADAVNTAAHAGGGFAVTGTGANYPKEVGDDWLVGEKHHLAVRDVVKFHAEGGIWNDDMAVSMGGFASSNNDPIVVYPNSGHPTIPANRFLNVAFSPGGRSDTLSVGHLDVNISPYERVMEPAWNPHVVFRVWGRFDPTGPGDTNYYFELIVDTYGNTTLANAQSAQAQIEQDGDHVRVWLDSIWGHGT
jgi:hypothetical protein